MSCDKIPFIVFEGPDMCGKTSHIDTVVKTINELTKRNFKAFKFPVYDGFKGEKILKHLKMFNIDAIKSTDKAIEALTMHAVNLMVNKLDAFNVLLEDCQCTDENKCDGYIVDRFDISQIIYDIAWCKILYKKVILKSTLMKFYYDALYRAFVTHEYYSNKFDIQYIFFDSSKIISNISALDKDRRIDKYDSNVKYQQVVSELFNIFKSADCGDSYKYIFNKSIDPAFRSILNQTVVDSVLINNIDTDLYYKKYYTANPRNELNEYVLKSSAEETMVSNYKEMVTSDIDNKIVSSILDYLKLRERTVLDRYI